MNREKMQGIACMDTALEYLQDAYRQLREASEYVQHNELNILSSKILSDMIELLNIERKVNNADEI